jgi:Chaperone of endosialidase
VALRSIAILQAPLTRLPVIKRSIKIPPGGDNTATGYQALYRNTTGISNTAAGSQALLSNTTGNFNTATGDQALNQNTTGSQNNAFGASALSQHMTGDSNNAVGSNALLVDHTGISNNAFGNDALAGNINGNFNTAIGDAALLACHGSSNTAIGVGAGANVNTAHNAICIGSPGADVSDSFYVANVFETSIAADNLPVHIDVTGRLGTQSSSRRFKKDIATMERASEAILSLRPVTFHYKTDTKGAPQFGLIAEEVAKVNPALVLPDKEGKPYTVRYDQVNAMLLNEFLKEHRRVQELEATVAQQRKDSEATAVRQQKQIEALTTVVQKVNAQLELSKSAPQTVLNNH